MSLADKVGAIILDHNEGYRLINAKKNAIEAESGEGVLLFSWEWWKHMRKVFING